MSFYRPNVRRWPAAVASATMALTVGVALGFTWGHSTAPDLVELAAKSKRELRGVEARLQVLKTEYPQAVQGSAVEYEGTVDRVAAVQSELKGMAPELQALNGVEYRQITLTVAQIAQQIRAKANSATVAKLVDTASSLIRKFTE